MRQLTALFTLAVITISGGLAMDCGTDPARAAKWMDFSTEIAAGGLKKAANDLVEPFSNLDRISLLADALHTTAALVDVNTVTTTGDRFGGELEEAGIPKGIVNAALDLIETEIDRLLEKWGNDSELVQSAIEGTRRLVEAFAIGLENGIIRVESMADAPAQAGDATDPWAWLHEKDTTEGV